MAKKITGYVKLQIPAGEATPAPPVGTVKFTVAPFTGWPPASVTFAARPASVALKPCAMRASPGA